MQKQPISIKDIFEDACNVFNISIEDVINNSSWEYSKIKKIVSYVSIRTPMWSFPQIMKELGYSSHASILKNRDRIRLFIECKDDKWNDAWNQYTTNSRIWKELSNKQNNN